MTKVYKTYDEQTRELRQDKTLNLINVFKNNNKPTMKKAFSLIELLVVILILGLLAGFVVPNIMGKLNDSQRNIACTQMASNKQALKMFKMDNGAYPETEEGFEALVSNPDADKYPNYANSPYLEEIPKDPWGSNFIYVKTASDFKIMSLAADRKEGGEAEGKDIIFPDCGKKK